MPDEHLNDPWVIGGIRPEHRGRAVLAAPITWVFLLGAAPTGLKVLQNSGEAGISIATLAVVALTYEASLILAVRKHRTASVVGLLTASVAFAMLGVFMTGPTTVLVLVATLTIAHGALINWPPLVARSTPSPATRTLGIMPLAASQVVWIRGSRHWIVFLLLAASWLLLELAIRRPDVDRSVRRSIDSIAHRVVTAVFTAVLFVLAIPFIYLPGVVARLTRRGLGLRSTPASVWRLHDITADDERRDLRRPFASTPRSSRTARSAVGVACILATLLALVVWNHEREPSSASQPSGQSTRPAESQHLESFEAFAGAPWARVLGLNTRDYWSLLRFDVAGGWTVSNLRSAYINVSDGERRTISTSVSGKPLQIWLLGGSVAFGTGQRDDNTVASDLVRLAAADGMAVEVENLAVPATVNWQTTMLLAKLLEWRPKPDLVVVLDGENDVALQVGLMGTGQGHSDEPATLLDAEFEKMLRSRHQAGVASTIGIDVQQPQQSSGPVSPDDIADAIATRYGRGVDVARTLAAGAGVPIRFFWQPTLLRKSNLSDSDRSTLNRSGIDDSARRLATSVHSRIFEQLAPMGVEDLSAAYDGQSDPIYWDQVHTNELGASLLAKEMYMRLRPQLLGGRG